MIYLSVREVETFKAERGGLPGCFVSTQGMVHHQVEFSTPPRCIYSNIHFAYYEKPTTPHNETNLCAKHPNHSFRGSALSAIIVVVCFA